MPGRSAATVPAGKTGNCAATPRQQGARPAVRRLTGAPPPRRTLRAVATGRSSSMRPRHALRLPSGSTQRRDDTRARSADPSPHGRRGGYVASLRQRRDPFSSARLAWCRATRQPRALLDCLRSDRRRSTRDHRRRSGTAHGRPGRPARRVEPPRCGAPSHKNVVNRRRPPRRLPCANPPSPSTTASPLAPPRRALPAPRGRSSSETARPTGARCPFPAFWEETKNKKGQIVPVQLHAARSKVKAKAGKNWNMACVHNRATAAVVHGQGVHRPQQKR